MLQSMDCLKLDMTELLNNNDGTSLTIQWLGLHLPGQEVQVQSLDSELRSHGPCGQKNQKYKTEAIL